MTQTSVTPRMQFIHFDDAFQRLQISRNEMMALVQNAVVRGYKYGKEIYLDLCEVEALITSRNASK
ncbi:MAG: hypothetical protein ACOYYS_11435 [Chloroflexota bacterium]